MHKTNTCDCFEPGQVWESPRGFLYAVIGYAPEMPGKRKQVVLRLGENGKGRKQLRDWDAVVGWTIYRCRSTVEISIEKESSREVGSCKACLNHMGNSGAIEHVVWNITLRGMGFRVCESCKKELLRLLTAAK